MSPTGPMGWAWQITGPLARSFVDSCINDRAKATGLHKERSPGLPLETAMNVLIVGSGGREHAIAWRIAESNRADGALG